MCGNRTDQVEVGCLSQQLYVGATAVDTRLEVHLIPEHRQITLLISTFQTENTWVFTPIYQSEFQM